MQLHAIDHLGQFVSARRAQRHQNYRCPECHENVRLRGGPHRQPHFYHLEPILSCRQHQKGPVHLQLQKYLFSQLPVGECQLEFPFLAIGRIADVAWISQRIVFEIQCSPISAEEALARNQDYGKEGWSVVWILHDQRYNRTRMSAVELALRDVPYFYSNMNASGVGYIYDQFDLCDEGIRYGRLAPLPIDLKNGIFSYQEQGATYPLALMQKRAVSWPYYFSGDLMSQFLQGNLSHDYLNRACMKEKEFAPIGTMKKLPHYLGKFWHRGIVIPYQIVFRFLLERLCR